MRAYPLGNLRYGINRLNVKGAVNGQQLYDLVNGFITADGTIGPREGTIRKQTLSSSTVGLSAMNGVFNVFATSLVSVPSGYKCNVLLDPNDNTQALKKIWFAKPFMGFLYVAAEFNNGDVWHYWLQNNGSWAANTVYFTGAIVEPPTPNGFGYLAVRDTAPNSTWQANMAVTLNMLIEPTTYNGFMYKATAVAGSSPHTSNVEPSWPATENATVQEFGDFDTTSSASSSSSSSSTPLGSTITDRYGNSSEIAGQTGTTSTATTTVAASTTVTTWKPGVTYSPGAVVKPSTNQGAFIGAIPNGDFEAGNDGNWVLSPITGAVAFDTTHQYQGTYCLSVTCDHGNSYATMNTYGTVTPGQSVSASCYTNPNNSGNGGLDYAAVIALRFHDSSGTFISETQGPSEHNPGYRKTTVTATAPATAARVYVRLYGFTGTSNKTGYFDLVTWNLAQPAAVSSFLFEAVQANSGSSGTTEPSWPTVAGNTVNDNGVIWKAIGTSIVTWTAVPLMKSGSSTPTFPTTPGLTVKDGTMSWQCIDRHITDSKCPQTKAVALGASHVFAGDKDIVDFCAAVDPTDWSSDNNAGYLPTGLNNYGDNPVSVLALYRGNLIVFNSGGYQMWQIDPDPANMALLDAQPVGSIWPLATQSVANDLLFLTEVGVRNLSTVGATANMAIGQLGNVVDPIIRAQIVAGTYDPISLYYPGRGQYWLIFGPQAFVLTVNGNGRKTWSRYVFPESITDATINAGVLYLRTSGNHVWQVDDATLVDDFGGANVGFTGIIQWPYVDCGSPGINKMLEGLDIVGTGTVTVQFGFNQNDPTSFDDNAGFATSQSVTTPYTVSIADTVPGEPLPIPLNSPTFSLILTFAANQAWGFQTANLYLIDQGGGGATG